jgi:hypothetical protein
MSRTTNEASPTTGALAPRASGKRHIKLTIKERKAIKRRRLAEAAATMFLDLDNPRTWKEIAGELKVGVDMLKDLSKSPEFDEAYNALMVDISHDPRFKATQAALSDMLPIANQRLKNLLTNPNTPATALIRAIEDVHRLNGLVEPQPQGSERRELAEFLKNHDININFNLGIPPEYTDALNYLQREPIEAEVREITEVEPGGEDRALDNVVHNDTTLLALSEPVLDAEK